MCMALFVRFSGLILIGIISLCGCKILEPVDDTVALEAKRVRAFNIKSEPIGDYYIGRRHYVDRMRFWGYLRSPRQDWEESELVVMNEKFHSVPDRLPEISEEEEQSKDPEALQLKKKERFGFDHNYEYKIQGHYSGAKVYDPNSNMVLSEFILIDYELIDVNAGWLFSPREVYDPKNLPKFRGR